MALAQVKHIELRRRVARSRIERAHGLLGCCRFCHHFCGVNRLQGERGKCHADAVARIFSAQTEVSDELLFAPVYAIAFSGCDMRCDFCITGASSWNPNAGKSIPIWEIASSAVRALESGARSIMFLGGEVTIHLPTVIRLVAELPDEAILIWKTNGHITREAMELLDGLFDFWVVDYKFGNDTCAQRLSRTKHYTGILQDNLTYAQRHANLVIRHLLMPGHVTCCWQPIANWIAETLPDVQVSLRTGFWPAWKSDRHEELRHPVHQGERTRAQKIAQDLCLQLIP